MKSYKEQAEMWRSMAHRLERAMHEAMKLIEDAKLLDRESVPIENPAFGKYRPNKEESIRAWIGVDFDGTLAEYHGWRGPAGLGIPIPEMLNRVKAWLADGLEVKIVTARVCSGNRWKNESRAAITAWCMVHIGQRLDITAEKDYGMVKLWDYRAVTVEVNTGRVLTTEARDHKKHKL